MPQSGGAGLRPMREKRCQNLFGEGRSRRIGQKDDLGAQYRRRMS